MPNPTIRLRVICLRLPPEIWQGKPTTFGLQDKDGNLDAGQRRDDGAHVYEFEAQVKLEGDAPNFLGKYAHGTPAERFVYLGWRYLGGSWVQRIKIPLKGITREQVEQAAANGAVLQAVVEDGTAAATIKLKNGWQIV